MWTSPCQQFCFLPEQWIIPIPSPALPTQPFLLVCRVLCRVKHPGVQADSGVHFGHTGLWKGRNAAGTKVRACGPALSTAPCRKYPGLGGSEGPSSGQEQLRAGAAAGPFPAVCVTELFRELRALSAPQHRLSKQF